MRLVPLRSVASQTLSVLLAGQNCRLNLYQKSTGFFLDLYINDAAVLTTVICRDRVTIVRDAYRGFVGDLVFADNQGTDDPYFDELASRFLLYYIEEADL